MLRLLVARYAVRGRLFVRCELSPEPGSQGHWFEADTEVGELQATLRQLDAVLAVFPLRGARVDSDWLGMVARPTSSPGSSDCMPPLFESCIDSHDAALASAAGGAGRVELCARLDVGGTTPDAALIAGCVASLAFPCS